jgi:hypothetical protein
VAAGEDAPTQGWQIALSLTTAWRKSAGGRRDAVARRLAEAMTEGGPAAVEQAVLGLTDVAGMFIEPHADSAGLSPDAVLQDAGALSGSDGAAFAPE